MELSVYFLLKFIFLSKRGIVVQQLHFLFFCFLMMGTAHFAQAAIYTANPSNYRATMSGLQPGDVLNLEAGTYTRLNISNLRGTSSARILIQGPATGSPAVIAGELNYNTVEIRNSSFVTIRNLRIDSQGRPGHAGISAKDGAVNLTHNITIANCTIVGVGGSQQTVAISTKTPTWNWIIRGNTIIGAGTGLYLGDSDTADGGDPFINGLIEGNLIKDSIGYNAQIKRQVFRPAMTGMPTGPGRTVIRHNVFIKNDNICSSDGCRPNLLTGGFPDSGSGSSDMYEIYGNFFFNNRYEALFQGTGRISLHDNIFVQPHANGYPAVSLVAHDGKAMQIGFVYNNTIYTPERALSISSLPAIDHAIVGNLIFAATPLSGSYTAANVSGNLMDTYANAGFYVRSPSNFLGSMDFHPLNGQTVGPLLNTSKFSADTGRAVDFDGKSKDGTFRGAYATLGDVAAWQLQAAKKPLPKAAALAAEIIIDNSSSQTAQTGTWCVSAATGFYGTNSVYSCGSALDTFRFVPNIPVSQSYDVYVRWTSHANRSTNVPVTVRHAGGDRIVNFNMQTGGGAWVLHGRYSLSTGSSHWVEVSDKNGQASADAVRLAPVP